MMSSLHRKISCLSTLVFCIGFPFFQANADTLTLINGDHLTGKLIEREGKRLQFKTEYAGKIRVKWEHVRSLEIDEPALLLFDTGETKSVLSVEVKEQEVTYRDAGDNKLHTLQAHEIVGISPESWMKNDSGIWDGRVNLSIKSDRGNGGGDFADFDADITYQRLIDRVRVRGEWEQDTKVKDKTREIKVIKDKWLLNGSYNYFINKKSTWVPAYR
jgi:hypothetical protein